MNRRHRWAIAVALCAVAAVAYLPSIDGAFQFDDNGIFTSPAALAPSAYLSPATWRAQARPLTSLLFAVDHAIGGFRPRVWHATNVAIHLAAVLLAWLLARRLLARAFGQEGEGASAPPGAPTGPAATVEWIALAAAALFALHPIQTEAVSYLSQRAEALAASLYFAGLLVLLARDAAASRPRRALLLAASAALHAVALAAKPTAATMPAAWLLAAALLPLPAEHDVPWGVRVARRLSAALPLLALSAWAAVGGAASARTGDHAGFTVSFVTPLGYLATQLRAIPRYLALLLLPARQNVDWEFPFSGRLLEPKVVGGAALLALVTAAALLAVERWGRGRDERAALARLAAFTWLFFLVALAPTIVVPLRDAFVEHRLYLALLGPALLVAAGVAVGAKALAPARAGAVAGALAAAALGAAFAATWQRNRVWESPLALWSDAAEKSPGKARVWANLGASLSLAGRDPEAVGAYDRAIALAGDSSVPMSLVMKNLTIALVALRRHDDARERLQRYLVTRPGDASGWVLLGQVEVSARRLDAAERAVGIALGLDPVLPPAMQVRGQIHEKRGDLAGAYALYAEAARLDPADPLAPYSMA
ncbi:MAG TPA: tetratricopeptide repeat protein, partial [Anaeromyxobacteraceae bacterium]|nr:tetratricopeptide repeat protein [Anaeromyxobacteraceae bacterium]